MYGVPREFVSRTKSSTDALLNAPYSMPSNLSNNKLYRCISGTRAEGREILGQPIGPHWETHEVRRTRGESHACPRPRATVQVLYIPIERCQKLVLILAVRSTECRLSHQSSQSIPQSSRAGRLAPPGHCATLSRNSAQPRDFSRENSLFSTKCCQTLITNELCAVYTCQYTASRLKN
jgi:hypothetical protein